MDKRIDQDRGLMDLGLSHPASGVDPDDAEFLASCGIVTIGEALDGMWALGLIEGPPPPGMRERLRATRLDDPDLGLGPETIADWAGLGIHTVGGVEDYREARG